MAREPLCRHATSAKGLSFLDRYCPVDSRMAVGRAAGDPGQEFVNFFTVAHQPHRRRLIRYVPLSQGPQEGCRMFSATSGCALLIQDWVMALMMFYRHRSFLQLPSTVADQ